MASGFFYAPLADRPPVSPDFCRSFPPALVDALIKANKDFDLIMFPNRGHGFGSEPYMVRRRWDYFVQHLLGAEPPREFELKPPPTDSRGRAGF